MGGAHEHRHDNCGAFSAIQSTPGHRIIHAVLKAIAYPDMQ
jgi:hypothetical protein